MPRHIKNVLCRKRQAGERPLGGARQVCFRVVTKRVYKVVESLPDGGYRIPASVPQ
jgi:hypothetical protein